MRILIACLASALLTGLLAAPLSSASGPWDDLPVVGPLAGPLIDSVQPVAAPVVDLVAGTVIPVADQVTDLCFVPFDNSPPGATDPWVVTYNDASHAGVRVWIPATGKWEFAGLCNPDGRLRLLNLCVVPNFPRYKEPAPSSNDPADHIRDYTDLQYHGQVFWVAGGPNNAGSWWFAGLCPDAA